MGVRPVVRHFIACKKDPSGNDSELNLNDVFVYAIKPKAPFQYPVWHKPFFLFAIVTNGLGACKLRLDLRLVELGDEREVPIGESNDFSFDSGQDRLRVWPLSIMMPAVLLPKAGLFRLYLIADGEIIACEEVHAR